MDERRIKKAINRIKTELTLLVVNVRNMRELNETNIKLLSQESLKELRRKQKLVKAQIPIAFEQKNVKALGELQVREKEIACAIDKKVFGGYK